MTMFASLRLRNYRLFASGQVVSLTGTWMQRVAQDWLVLRLSHNSGTAIGLTTGLQFLPYLIFSLYGGVLADRYNKRKLLMLTQVSSAVPALFLGILDTTGVVHLWHVYLLALVLGVASSVDTPTRQAFVSELVGQEQLANAVGLNSATFNTARILGPAIAGVMIAAIGTGPVFLVNAGSYFAVILGLSMIRDSELFTGKRAGRSKGQLRAAMKYVRGRPHLILPIALAGILGTFGFNFQMTTALLAKETFHRSATGYGLLSTVLAVGSLCGALLAARRTSVRKRLVVGSAIAFGVFTMVAGVMPTYATFAIALVPTGVAALTFSTSANSMCQLGSSPAMRGRVMALYFLVFTGGTPFGAPMIGWVAERLGARFSLVAGGGISMAAGLVAAFVMLRRSDVNVVEQMRRRAHTHGRSEEREPSALDEARSA